MSVTRGISEGVPSHSPANMGRRSQGGWPWFTLAAISVAALVALFVIFPILTMVARLFFQAGWPSLEPFRHALDLPGISSILLNTGLAIATGSVLALCIASVLAWLNERTDARMGWAGDVIPIIPLLIPGIVMSIGWSFLLAPTAGFLNIAIRMLLPTLGINISHGPFDIYTWPGLIFVYTLFFIPFAYLPIAAAFRDLNSSYEEAARVCGASPLTTFLRVTLPAISPAIGSAFLVLVVLGVALYSVPAVIGLRSRIDVLPVKIVELVNRFPPREDVALVLGLIMFLLVFSAWLFQRRMIGRSAHAMLGGKTSARTELRLGVWRIPAKVVILTYLAVTTILPFGALLVVSTQPYWSPAIVWSSLSFDNFAELASTSYTRRAIVNSFVLSVAAASVAMAIAAVISYWCQRDAGLPSRLAEAVLKLPASVSNILLGVGFVLAFAGWPFNLGGTVAILLLAYVVVHLPQASFIAEGAISQIGRPLVEAAFVSGAGLGRTFTKIVLPLIRSGLVAGWAILFVTMLGDLTVSAILAGTNAPVIGFVMLELWQGGTYPAVAALGVVVTVLSSLIVCGVLVLNRWAAE